MRWSSIERIDIKEVTNMNPLRYLVTMHRIGKHCNDDSIVTAGGIKLSDALVTLFSTAGLGRFAPTVLAEIIEKKIDCSLTDSNWNRILSVLRKRVSIIC